VSQPRRSQAETVISRVGDQDGGADPTELINSAQPGNHRPNDACNTSHIMPPSRICVVVEESIASCLGGRGWVL
jgi:hypothetical protein